MIPASSGWVLDVVFFGKNTTLISENIPPRRGGWHGALSMNKKMFLFSLSKRWFNFDKIESKISEFIQAFRFEKHWHIYGRLTTFKFLKHLGLAYFPMTMGSFSPAAIAKKAQVFRYFAFLPPLHRLSFSLRVFSGNSRQIHVPKVSRFFNEERHWNDLNMNLNFIACLRLYIFNPNN